VAHSLDAWGDARWTTGDACTVERLRELDPVAWASLYDEHHARIWRYLYARTGSRDAADDLAALVFVEALSSIQRYRSTGKPIVAWLYRIAAHHLAKWFRANKRDPRRGVRERADDLLDRRLISITLGEALRSLTADQREVILLRYFGDYSTREIAAAMGRSPAAVYSLQERALERMRQLIGDRADFEASLPAKPRPSRV
jgi:RNA polymerase sigma factor (sigma-70 family)